MEQGWDQIISLALLSPSIVRLDTFYRYKKVDGWMDGWVIVVWLVVWFVGQMISWSVPLIFMGGQLFVC